MGRFPAISKPRALLGQGARGVSGGGSLRSGLSTAVTAVHPDAVTPIPGATAPSPAVRRCANDGADVCSSRLLARARELQADVKEWLSKLSKGKGKAKGKGKGKAKVKAKGKGKKKK